MTSKDAVGSSVAQVPEADGLVERGRGELRAIGSDGDREDSVVVAAEIVDERAVGDGINPHHARACRQARAQRQPAAVAAEHQGVNRAGNLLDRSRGRAVVKVPEDDLPVRPDREQARVTAKREGRDGRQRADR